MEVCLSTIALEPNRWGGTRLPKKPQLERLIPLIARGGFDAIEIWEGHLMVESPVSVYRLVELAAAERLRVPVVGIYLNMGAEGRELNQQRLKVDYLVNAAKLFGSRIVKYFAGNKPYKEADDAFKARAVRCLHELCEKAEQAGLLLAAETHGGTVTDCQEGALWWAKQSKSPAHRLLYQAYSTNTEQAVEQFKGVAPYSIYMHIQGVAGKEYVLLKDADLDFARLLKAARSCGFDGWICIEFAKDCTQPEDRFDDAQVLRNALIDKQFVLRAWGS